LKSSLENQSITCIPFLKWAGGKRWLVTGYQDLFPSSFKTYLEPFLGSASVFFALNPLKAILADLNDDLIQTYQTIKDDPEGVYEKLRIHQLKHCDDYYYLIRKTQPRSNVMRAARFIYLNRTCFNGLYRVNFHGKFNVPLGSKIKVLMDSDNFELTAKRLESASLLKQDFEKTISLAKSGDYIFADPPYTVSHNNNGFIKYNQTLFSWDDQLRLKKALKKASNRGAHFLLCNAQHECIRALYPEFKQNTVNRYSILAADRLKRDRVEEIVITNY
jgi:DNA adenine methylase